MLRTVGRRRAGPFAEVWRFRELLWSLVLRNLKVKYQSSALGFVWTLLSPLVTVAVLVAVFGSVLLIPLENYWAFLLSGYFVWHFVQQTVNAGSYTLGEHAPLSRSVAFPTEVLLLAATLSRLVEFGAELLLVLVALAVFHHGGVPASFAFVPFLILLQILVASGLQLTIATLSVFYKDVQHALPIVLTTVFWLSPVFYPVAMVPAEFRTLYLANPIAQVLTLYHQVVYEAAFPSPALLAAATASSLTIATAGYAIFRRYKTVFAELV